MTPFERSENNIKVFCDNITMFSLIQSTIEETKDLNNADSDQVWMVIFTLLEKTGKMVVAN